MDFKYKNNKKNVDNALISDWLPIFAALNKDFYGRCGSKKIKARQRALDILDPDAIGKR